MIEEKNPSGSKPSAAPTEESTNKSKRCYSKRWKSIQRVERGTTKAARRLTAAVSDGVNVWIDAREKSAERRKDGAVRDVRKNVKKAIRKTVREASSAPADVFDALTRVRIPEVLGLGRRWF
jgi:hypothetical protein